MADTSLINVRIQTELHDRLKAYAERHSVTVTTIIKLAIVDYLDRNESQLKKKK